MIKKQNKKTPLHLDVKHLHREPKPEKTPKSPGNQELKQMPNKMLKCSILVSLYIRQSLEDTGTSG